MEQNASPARNCSDNAMTWSLWAALKKKLVPEAFKATARVGQSEDAYPRDLWNAHRAGRADQADGARTRIASRDVPARPLSPNPLAIPTPRCRADGHFGGALAVVNAPMRPA